MIWGDIVAFIASNAMIFRIIVIVLGALLVRAIVVSTSDRVIARVVAESNREPSGKSKSSNHSAGVRLTQRTQTLGSVLRSFANWAIGAVSVVLILGELGFDVTAIIASLGILGAGLAIGAQDIVRDLFNGIFMVFEDQLGVGDTVDLGDAKGVVEAVTIRITKVRDSKGVLWFVRNGQIQRVANSSHRA